MPKVCCVAVLLIFLIFDSQCLALSDLSNRYLRVDIQTTKLTNFLAFPKSNLAPVVRADVSFEGMDGDSTPKTLYKSIWYGNGVCIGSQRRTMLAVGASEPVEIHIRLRNLDGQQANAAVGASLRLYLETQLQNAYAGSIYVAPEHFDTVCDALRRQFFVPYSEANGVIGSANITLVNEDHSRQIALTFAPPKS